MTQQQITIRAKTVDEAIRLALEHLGLERREVTVEFLEIPGLGDEPVEEALVRVTAKHAKPAPTPAPRQPPSKKEQSPGQIGYEILSEMLERMGFSARINLAEYAVIPGESQPMLEVTTSGERDSGLLIGRRGETLHQLQFLVNLMVSRRTHRWPYILVDVENYRRRRDASLKDMAKRIAERVEQSERPITLEPMSAYERRIVHLTLRDDPHVVTQSTGEGDSRKVVIYPAEWELPDSSS